MHKQDEDNQKAQKQVNERYARVRGRPQWKLHLSWLNLSEMNTLAVLETGEN